MSLKIIADALKAIMDREKEILNQHEVKHGPTIGDMYEGLTKSLLERLNLSGLGLKVVSGFMRAGEELSGQLDCMIVLGQGQKINYLDKYVYPARQVLAVIEIKKTIYARQFEDAYGQLADVLRVSKLDLKRQEEEGSLKFSTLRPALEYMKVFGERPPKYDDKKVLGLNRRMVYQWLVDEHLAPLRIAIGYYGFKTQSGFREAIGSFYEAKENLAGYGVLDMPSLVISENSSIVKTAGLPYSGAWHDEAGWLWLCSSGANPALLLLEFLIDRIERVLGVTIDRGDDVNLELNNPLVSSMPLSLKDRVLRVTHNIVPADEIYESDGVEQWEPYRLTLEEKELLELVSARGSLLVAGQIMNSFRARHKIIDASLFIGKMLAARVVLRTNGELAIYPGMVIVKVQDEFYCADNSGGRFAQWVSLRFGKSYDETVYLEVGEIL
jgi:hypothetical protein